MLGLSAGVDLKFRNNAQVWKMKSINLNADSLNSSVMKAQIAMNDPHTCALANGNPDGSRDSAFPTLIRHNSRLIILRGMAPKTGCRLRESI